MDVSIDGGFSTNTIMQMPNTGHNKTVTFAPSQSFILLFSSRENTKNDIWGGGMGQSSLHWDSGGR